MELPAEKVTPVVKRDTDSVKKAAQPSDTTKKAILKPDSALNTANAALPLADTVKGPVFAVFLGSFKTVTKGTQEAENYKKKGVDARIYTGRGTGKLIKVITGSFATYEEAKAEKDRLVKAKKIKTDSYPYQLVKPQK